MLEEAGDLEEELRTSIILSDEERDELSLRASRLRGGAELNMKLRDVPYVGWLLSEAHYFLSTSD